MEREFNLYGSDKVITRGRCAACKGGTSEGNKVYWFPTWRLDLCKSCFIRLSSLQLEELSQSALTKED